MRRMRDAKRDWKQAALLLAGVIADPPTALADFKVKLPEVNPGEFELETVGNYGRSGNPDTDNEKSFVHELEYGFTNFWKGGLEFETNRVAGPGNHLQFDALTLENWFVLGEPGQYWLDSAMFVEYGHGMPKGSPNEIKFGPLLRKEIGPTLNTVNLFLARELGLNAGNRTAFSYAWETRIATGWVIEPGFQAYGEPGDVSHFRG